MKLTIEGFVLLYTVEPLYESIERPLKQSQLFN